MFVRIFLSFLLFLISCKNYFTTDVFSSGDQLSETHIISDTLHVATLYGASSYFNYSDQEVMGYDYELVQAFAQANEIPLKVHVAATETEMLKMLKQKRVDLIAYNMFETKALKHKFDFVAYQEDSYMVLVQEVGREAVGSINELKGRTVHVIENSIYHQRLVNLNKEIGGDIDIQLLSDSLTIDQAIEMVLQRKIEFTFAPHKIAVQYKDFHRRLDCGIRVGFPQKNGWLVNRKNEVLKTMIAHWEADSKTELFKSHMYEKYKIKNPYFRAKRTKVSFETVSPYDDYFKTYAEEINWDWRLLAAVAFHESNFDSLQVSHRGASGLMQLMPSTAAIFGLDEDNIFNPEKNIEAGVQYIKSLNRMFGKIENQEERKKFILASYNSGPAHILDAMALAEKYGKNPHIWFEHVEYYLSKSNDPDYYNDEVVRYGKFGPSETIRYVRNTLDTYKKYKQRS